MPMRRKGYCGRLKEHRLGEWDFKLSFYTGVCACLQFLFKTQMHHYHDTNIHTAEIHTQWCSSQKVRGEKKSKWVRSSNSLAVKYTYTSTSVKECIQKKYIHHYFAVSPDILSSRVIKFTELRLCGVHTGQPRRKIFVLFMNPAGWAWIPKTVSLSVQTECDSAPCLQLSRACQCRIIPKILMMLEMLFFWADFFFLLYWWQHWLISLLWTDA